MREIVIVLTFLVLSGVPAWAQAARPATEQAWILADVMAAIEGMSGKTSLPAPVITDHIWSPATYRAAAEAAFEPAPAGTDLNVRANLTNLTSAALVEQSSRVSLVLERNMRAPEAHEAAALIVGTFALREAFGWFQDVRPSLSRMAAHLAVARALRRPSTDETLDGTLARAILTALVGHQRRAMTVVDEIEAHAASDADRAWVRALRLRITGDWRVKPTAGAPLLVQLEYGRAVRERLDADAYLDYLDGLHDTGGVVDWARIAVGDGLNLEAGRRFTEEQIKNEILETVGLWMAVNGRDQPPEASEFLRELDARPAASPVERSGQWVKVRVLDWGAWAAHQQRHLAHAFVARAQVASERDDDELYDDVYQLADERFGSLRLFPIVLRWMARSAGEYDDAVDRARALVRDMPEVVTQQEWTLLLKKPKFAERNARFPLDDSWFTPAVPVGTAFELSVRALLQGGLRPPTRDQAAAWAREMPYDHWTQWGHQWLGVDGKPELASVRKALGPLLEYDESALLKLLDYMNLPPAEWFGVARTLCEIVPGQCDRLADMQLVAGLTADAVQTYDKWVDRSRDRLDVSNGLTWIFRYHFLNGNTARADRLAHIAEESGSWAGLQLAAEWHERQGRLAVAERVLHEIEDRYDDSTPMGTFLMRRALASNDKALQAKAVELLRDEYPLGPEPLVAHALPAGVSDGIRFKFFGTRLQSFGFESGDVIVGVDGWRVHNYEQSRVVSRFSYNETMTFTVFRKGKYEEVRVKSPERWLGAQFVDIKR